MKKTHIKCGIIFMIMIFSTLFGIEENNAFKNNEQPFQINAGNEEIDQIQEDVSGGFEKLYGDIELVQSFKPSREKLTRVEIFLSRCKGSHKNLGNVVLSIREDINREDLTSSSVSPEKIDVDGKWIIFDFPDISVNDHQTYYLVCHTSGGSNNDYYLWYYSEEGKWGDPYPCGEIINTLKTTGDDKKERDFAFKIYGSGDGIVERWAIAMGFGFDACREDARNLQKILYSCNPNLWPLDHILVYDYEETAIWDNIINGLRWIESQEDSNDITLWQSAGHGSETGLYDDHTILPYTTLDKEFDRFEGRVVIMIVACFSYKAHTYLGEPGRIIMVGRSETPPPSTSLTEKKSSDYVSSLDGYTYFISHFTRPERGGAWANEECDVNRDGWISAEEAFYYVLNTYSWPGRWSNGYLYPSMYDGIDGELPITFVRGYNNPPDKPLIKGPIVGDTFTNYSFSVCGNDPDGDNICYLIDWGDGDTTGWKGTFPSQKEVTFSHMWNIPGNYTIKAKCMDELREESEWSSLNISILPDTIPPETEIRSPKQGYLYIFNREIGKTFLNKTIIIGKKSIFVIARDNLFVTKVEFYIDDRFKYSDDDIPYLWTWDEPAFGKHSIKVMAYDRANNIGNAEITVWAFI